MTASFATQGVPFVLFRSRISTSMNINLKHLKKVVSFVLFSLLGITFQILTSSVYAQNALDNIQRTKTIKIAIPTDYPPYGFVGVDLQPQGLDVEMAQLIGQKLGVKVELIPVSSPNRVPYLQTKKVDLVISTLGRNAEREKVIDFTHAYAPYYQAVFGPKSLSIKTFNDLSGKTISATRGSLEDTELTKLAPAAAQIKRFEDSSSTIAAYVAGQVQLVATGASVATAMIQKNPQLGAEFKLLIKDSPCFIGVAKGEDSLRAKVNEVIVAAHKAGDLERLSQKWLARSTGELPE